MCGYWGTELTIGGNEVVRDHSQRAGLGVQAVDLVPQTRLRAEVLPVSVLRVGEVDVSIATVHSDVIERVELSAEVVVDKD